MLVGAHIAEERPQAVFVTSADLMGTCKLTVEYDGVDPLERLFSEGDETENKRTGLCAALMMNYNRISGGTAISGATRWIIWRFPCRWRDLISRCPLSTSLSGTSVTIGGSAPAPAGNGSLLRL